MDSKKEYIELLKQFPPRPIKSEEDLEATQAMVNYLLDKPKLTEEESDYLDVLGMLIYDYEKDLDIVPDIYGVELLKVLLEERNLKQKDLVSIFKTESIVSDILNEKRQLTTRHIQELAKFFNLSPAVFFPRSSV
ncbi:type II toxin-antitoxin system HigA family antitoxin [Cyanothece sp. BG0011]|uniref:helix-turn-helix domain-containing protein n=1 Tax=Cyanothece sp. BG0011 TaxID=2082950 RepID=UPI000D1FD188|nr:transcriptional regulator [Cyanothece sp. BG0011]